LELNFCGWLGQRRTQAKAERDSRRDGLTFMKIIELGCIFPIQNRKHYWFDFVTVKGWILILIFPPSVLFIWWHSRPEAKLMNKITGRG
jgi:hypothetical protein